MELTTLERNKFLATFFVWFLGHFLDFYTFLWFF